MAMSRLNGYVLEGAGEIIVWDASDFENFLAPRPELTAAGIAELTEVTTIVAGQGWPIRIHATYDETISTILDVFEKVFDETEYKARWAIDHAETISPHNIERIKMLGGGIAVQDRLAYAGEFFLERYGDAAAATASPLKRIAEAGVPLGAGTDATRVASYNPWVSLHYLTTGLTVGGAQAAARANLLTREQALRAYTVGSAWFSGEEQAKGVIAEGQYADFAILSDDFMTIAEDRISSIESVLTVTGGDVVHAAAPYADHGPQALPPARPEWSPVRVFGGYQRTSAH
jgi:hypothetical protein